MPADFSSDDSPQIFEDLAYVYDGTLEGLLCAIFESYRRKEYPTDVWAEEAASPRLLQHVSRIDTDGAIANRVHDGIVCRYGERTFNALKKASVSSDPHAGTVAFRFVRYAMDEHKSRRSPMSNLSHPSVEPMLRVCRSVSNECEHMRQFARFEHVCSGSVDFWVARINPKHSVVPLVMDYFVERFSVQAFVIYDENHGMCGIYDEGNWRLVRIDDRAAFESLVPDRSADEEHLQDAWRRFYDAVNIDERYNPELRRHFMPMRLWRNITEVRNPKGKPGLSHVEAANGKSELTHV